MIMTEIQEIIYHLKVIEIFLAQCSAAITVLLCMVALKYKGIL